MSINWAACDTSNTKTEDTELGSLIGAETRQLKDGAYYCYCAYVLRISTHSDFLSVMLTKTGIILRGLKLSGESRS